MATKRALPKGTKIEKKVRKGQRTSWIAYGPDGKPHGQHTSEEEAIRAVEQAAGISPGPTLEEIEAERVAHERTMKAMNPGYKIDRRTTRMRITA